MAINAARLSCQVGDIYFSYIRSPRILVRGTRGEISDSKVRYLLGPTEPMEFDLQRVDAGIGGQPDTLEGVYFKSYVGGGEYLTKNGTGITGHRAAALYCQRESAAQRKRTRIELMNRCAAWCCSFCGK